MGVQDCKSVASESSAGFKLFTLNQVINEVNCQEQPGVTFPGIFCKSNSLKRSY